MASEMGRRKWSRNGVSNDSPRNVADELEDLSSISTENRVLLTGHLSGAEQSRQAEILTKIWNIFMSEEEAIGETEIKILLRSCFHDFPAPFFSLLKSLQFGHRVYVDIKQKLDQKKNNKDHEIRYKKALNVVLTTFMDSNFPNNLATDKIQTTSFDILNEIEVEIDEMDIANRIFKYDQEPRRYLQNIRQLVARGNYKMAAQWVILLKLQSDFQITGILLPLILQNRMELTMSYLDLETEIRREKFIKLCDDCCQSRRKLEEMINKHKIKEVVNIKPRQLAKCIRPLSNKYEIPLQQLPNFKKWVQIFVVDRLIYSHYDRGEFDDEDWKDFIYGVVKGNFALQSEAIQLTVEKFGDGGRVKEWMKDWNLPMSKLHADIAKKLRNCGDKPPVAIPHLVDEVEYFQPKLPEIKWVENLQEYKDCLQYLSKSEVVGLDSEWKSNFGLNDTSENNKTAIIQMASSDRIYLLDLISLKLQAKDWKFFVDLFQNNSIIKLAFAFEDDWKNLAALCPSIFQSVDYKSNSFIELRDLRDALMAENHEIFPFYTADKEWKKGLGNVIELCFNLPLNKREQISNWEKRPLRESQKQYAALDAFCLVLIYQVIKRQCLDLRVDLTKKIQDCQLQ